MSVSYIQQALLEAGLRSLQLEHPNLDRLHLEVIEVIEDLADDNQENEPPNRLKQILRRDLRHFLYFSATKDTKPT